MLTQFMPTTYIDTLQRMRTGETTSADADYIENMVDNLLTMLRVTAGDVHIPPFDERLNAWKEKHENDLEIHPAGR